MKIKASGIACALAGLLSLGGCRTASQNNPDGWLKKASQTAVSQLEKAAAHYSPGMNPRSVNPDGTVRLASCRDWTTGFFPGSLWLGYEISGKEALAEKARAFTLALDSIQYFTHTHDLGFMLGCSYGNAFRITGDTAYLQPLENGARNLFGRYNSTVGAIRSWDFGAWQYPIIIDNMMNLELLFWASGQFQVPAYYQAAESHASVSMRDHYREDFSSYHVVSYDTLSGKPLEKGTHQGYSDSSAWSRGQAWGLYGFSMVYRHTKDKKFLEQAEHIAGFIMNHPRLPEDKIPYWDFDAPGIPDTAPRDVSAAAVTASAMLELSTQVPDGEKYFRFAEDILRSLSGDRYLAEPGSNHYFILKHSVGALPNNSEVDTPIDYADHYFLEALKRYAAIKQIDLKQ